VATDNRFNLIFHGMVGIIRSKSTAGWDVYVPIPQNCAMGINHVAKWGLPTQDGTGLDGLEDIPHQDFIMDFKCSPAVGSPCEFDPTQMIALRNLQPQTNMIWSKISVPAPSLIRTYRGLETSPGPNPDPHTLAALVAMPRLYYEIVVFSYLNVEGDITPIGAKKTVRPLKAADEAFTNLGIYYQALEQGPVQHDTTPFDNMFKVREGDTDYPIHVGTLTTQAPTSSVPADGPPAPLATDTGLQGMYLWSLSELNTRQLIQSNADKQAVVTALLNGERILVDGNVKCGGDPTSCGAVSGP